MAAIELGLGDRGREVQVTVGDTVTLRLPENPTTFVRWNAERLPDALEVVDDRNDFSPGAAPGAAAARILTVRALGPGRFGIELPRMQATEGERSTDEWFTCLLVVSGRDQP